MRPRAPFLSQSSSVIFVPIELQEEAIDVRRSFQRVAGV
jgi:hypothetical protein